MIAEVETPDGVYSVDLDDGLVLGFDAGAAVDPPAPVAVSLPRVVVAAARGSTVVAVVDTRPPMMVSHDAGRTWRESGRGLPAGRAVAIGEDPDLVLFASHDRLYLSRDGGRFWNPLGVEIEGIEALALREA